MPQKPLSPELRAQTLEAMARHKTQVAAAAELGISRSTLQARLRTAQTVAPAAPPPPAERHDSAFWRKKFADADRERGELHALVRELGGIDGLTIGAPSWGPLPASARQSHAVGIMHTSDWHVGEKVEPKEINGWNAYDSAIAADRAQRYTEGAIQKLQEWSATTALDGVLYTLAGDDLSGDIHEELRITNELTSMEQVQTAAGIRVASLARVADVFGRVHVVAVPGNHGRSTIKPTAKKYAALSYDILIARLVARELAGDARFSFQIADGSDAVIEIYGRNVLVLHGDKIGTGGGQGFAGPELPILRGVHKTRQQYASVGTKIDLVLGGHYHTSANIRGALFNGSLVGYNEYAAAIRAPMDVPRQWVAMYRARWGLSERLDLQLETPPKPRIRVMAATGAVA